MPPLDLSGMEAKLRRAQEHRRVLQQEIRAWFHNPHYKVIAKTNSDFTRHSIFLEKTDDCTPPIEGWSLTFGDAVHNLRSALDHLVFAIALTEASSPLTDKQMRKISFPICSKPANFVNSKANISQGCNLPVAVWAAIERVQPYNRTNPTLPPFLYLLSEFDNSDKHRLPHAFIGSPTEIKGRLEGFQPSGVVLVEAQGFAGALKENTEISWFVFSGPAPEMKYKIEYVDIAFLVPHEKLDPLALDWTGRSDAGALLREFTAEVEFVISKVKAAL